jgi:hypothetical protein
VKTLDETAERERTGRITALRRAIADNHTKSTRLVHSLELAEDVDQEFIRDLNERRAELRAERARLEDELAEAEDQVGQASNPALLDRLPNGLVDLTTMPDQLSRGLFEALRLEIHYDPGVRRATCRITLIGDTIDAVARSATDAVVIPLQRRGIPENKESEMRNTQIPERDHADRSRGWSVKCPWCAASVLRYRRTDRELPTGCVSCLHHQQRTHSDRPGALLAEVLDRRSASYLVAVACNQTIPATAGTSRADALAAQAPDDAWKRRSCGDGAKGPRLFDWAVASLPVYEDTTPPGWSRWLLVRRSLTLTARANSNWPTTYVAPQRERPMTT